MTNESIQEEPLIPRLLVSNALRAILIGLLSATGSALLLHLSV